MPYIVCFQIKRIQYLMYMVSFYIESIVQSVHILSF